MKQRLSAKTFFTTDPVLAKHRIPQQLSERRHVSVCKLHSREGRLRVRRHPPKRQPRQICSLPTLSHFTSIELRQSSYHFRVPLRWSHEHVHRPYHQQEWLYRKRPVNPFRSFPRDSRGLYSVTAEHDRGCGILIRGDDDISTRG